MNNWCKTLEKLVLRYGKQETYAAILGKSDKCAHFLLKFYWCFSVSFTRALYLLFCQKWRFAHKTTNTTILLYKGREIIWK